MNQHLNQSTWSWFSQASIFNASDVSLIRKIISDFCYFPYRREVKCEISESEKRRWHPDVKVLFQTNEWINQNAIVDWAALVLFKFSEGERFEKFLLLCNKWEFIKYRSSIDYVMPQNYGSQMLSKLLLKYLSS